jgi:hypothetical protein
MRFPFTPASHQVKLAKCHSLDSGTIEVGLQYVLQIDLEFNRLNTLKDICLLSAECTLN